MIAGIDHFKRVNDNCGHLVGDQVIKALAQVLQDNVKGRDIDARWGGEEFIVFLPETPAEGAVRLGEQLRLAFRKTRIKRGGKQEVSDPVTVSIGVAQIAPGQALGPAVDRADGALYQAKNDGRNCVRVAPSESTAAVGASGPEAAPVAGAG